MKILYLLSFLLFSLTATAQNTCEDQLTQAKRLYEQGQIYKVINNLTPCLESESLSRPVRREILSLLQEAYLFLDDGKMADSIHLDLLRLDPFFRQNIDIPEVRYLVDDFETYPVAAYAFRLGIYAFTRPLIDQSFFAFPDLRIDDINYKRRKDDLYGWTVNADISINLFKSSLEIGSGIGVSNIYLRRSLSFQNARPLSGTSSQATMSFLERQRWTQIPFLLKINGISRSKIIKSRFVPYFFVGGASEFLIKSTAQAIGPEIDFSGTENDRSASLIALGDQRRRFNFAFLAGVGGKFRFKRTYVLLDIRYHRLLQNIASDTNRFTNDELLNTFNYVDNDFRLQSLNISAGIGVFLFRSKKR